jgi:hypothetical protein
VTKGFSTLSSKRVGLNDVLHRVKESQGCSGYACTPHPAETSGPANRRAGDLAGTVCTPSCHLCQIAEGCQRTRGNIILLCNVLRRISDITYEFYLLLASAIYRRRKTKQPAYS